MVEMVEEVETVEGGLQCPEPAEGRCPELAEGSYPQILAALVYSSLIFPDSVNVIPDAFGEIVMAIVF